MGDALNSSHPDADAANLVGDLDPRAPSAGEAEQVKGGADVKGLGDVFQSVQNIINKYDKAVESVLNKAGQG